MLEEKIDEVEVEEERILAGGGKLGGSMVGRSLGVVFSQPHQQK